MGVQISIDSLLGRELWKWDHTTREFHPSDEDKPESERLYGVRPTTFQPFPKMVYKARKHPRTGQHMCMEGQPDPMAYEMPAQYERACLLNMQFNESCSLIVKNQQELDKAKNEGWKHSPPEALEHLEAMERDIADAAAEANWGAARMSEKAQREHAAAGHATSDHVVDVIGKKSGAKAVTGRGITE